MGNTRSSDDFTEKKDDDIWWTNTTNTRSLPKKPHSQDFQSEIQRIRERREEIIGAKRQEMNDLREHVKSLQSENGELKSLLRAATKVDKDVKLHEIEGLKTENQGFRREIQELRKELFNLEGFGGKNQALVDNIAVLKQEVNDLGAELTGFVKEREQYVLHVSALKDIINVSKQMILIKENQVEKLKSKLDEIEETTISLQNEGSLVSLKHEYEKQLQNMKDLRQYYEQRHKADSREKMELKDIIQENNTHLDNEKHQKVQLAKTIEELELENSVKYDTIKDLESNLGLTQAECRQYQSEMAVVNQLFSQLLLGFSQNQEIDIEKLSKQLEDNHDVLQHIINNETNESMPSVLPKVFLNLLNDLNESANNSEMLTEGQTVERNESDSTQSHNSLQTTEDIIDKLPKVWKVLIELLSYHCAPSNSLSDNNDEHPCYKTVDTPKGPSLVLSVSQTFIRLKNLIVEKRFLERETLRLRQLNSHLESKMQEQENRLGLVSGELSQTWKIVDQLSDQHQLLHTQETFLRYELAEKRKLLNELKEELKYSREKWLEAKQKNSNTEAQWKQLRSELSSRRLQLAQDHNSVESGFSDDRESSCSSSDEDDKSEDVNTKLVTDLDASSFQPFNSNLVSSDRSNVNDTENGGAEVDIFNKDVCVKASSCITNEEGATNKQTTVQTNSQDSNFNKAMSRREERLKRLEVLAGDLITQVSATNTRSDNINRRLEELHELYGSEPRDESDETTDPCNEEELNNN